MAAQTTETIRTSFPAGKYYIGDHIPVTDGYKCSDKSSFLSSLRTGNFSAETSLTKTKDFPCNIRIVGGCVSFIPYEDLCVYEDDANEFGMVISSKKPILVTITNGHFIIRSNQLFIYIDTNVVNKKDKFVYNESEHKKWSFEEDDDEEDEEEDDEEEDEEEEDEEDEDDE